LCEKQVLSVQMSNSAMLGEEKDDFDDCEKPKGSAINPEWVHPIDQREKGWEREPAWWEKGRGQKGVRDCLGSFVNIFYCFLLLGELALWIKVFLVWRDSPNTNANTSLGLLLPLILPSLALPSLALLHSLAVGRLSYTSAILLLIPPAPIVIHLIIIYRKLCGEEHHRISLASRATSLCQSLVMSLPLVTFSIISLLQATVEEEKVVLEQLHGHLAGHSFQGLATTLSLVNILVSALRFSERETGGAVSLLVGLPFLATNIVFRLIGFTFLFAYFEPLWILLVLGMLFCISALSVQFGAGQSLCTTVCRKMLADVDQDPSSYSRGPGLLACLLLSCANTLVPCGYSKDRRLGHVRASGSRLLLTSWLGSCLVLGLVINHCLSTEVPNVYTGLAGVDMSMIMPKTGLAVNLPHAGFDFRLILPKTKMTMEGDHPASYELYTSNTQDLVLALVVPLLLLLCTLPFAVLRCLLLDWDCALVSRHKTGTDRELQRAGKSRNCATVMCGVSGMMTGTCLLAITVVVYVMVIIQSTSNPLVREGS